MKTKNFYFLFFSLLQLVQTGLSAQPLEFARTYQSQDGNPLLFHTVKYHAPSQTYFAVGQSDNRASVTRIDQFGQHLWTNIYGDSEVASEFSSLAFAPGNQEVMLAGRTNLASNAVGTITGDIFLQRISLSGNLNWTNTDNVTRFTTTNGQTNAFTRLLNVKILNNGPWDSYWITALVSSSPGGGNDGLAVFSVNNQGYGPARYFGTTTNDDQIYDAISPGGSVFYCGNTVLINGSISPNPISYIHRALPQNGGQNLPNTKFQFNGSTANRLLSMNYTNNDGLVLAGSNNNNSTTGDGIILRLNPDRSVQWQVSTNDGIPFNSAIEMDDSTIVGVRTQTGFTDIVRLNQNGGFLNAQRLTGINGTRARIRLEHTGGVNDRVIVYGVDTNNDATLIVVDPENISCIGMNQNLQIIPGTPIVDTGTLPDSPLNLGTPPNDFNKENSPFQDLNLCCPAPISCTVQSDLYACADKGDFGFIRLNCGTNMSYNWAFLTASQPFITNDNDGSSTALAAGEGIYAVTITDVFGCTGTRSFQITPDCCEEEPSCSAPTGLNCIGTGTNAQLSWNPVPEATSYYVTITPNSASCCAGNNTVSTIYQSTTNTFQNVIGFSCFTWTVTAICEDESATSALVCYRDGDCDYISQEDNEDGFRNMDLNPKVYPNSNSN